MSLTTYGLIKKEFTDYSSSKVAILPIPYEGTVSYGKGTSLGPEAILKASKYLELYDIELKKESYKVGIHTLTPIKVVADPQKTNLEVYNTVKKIIKDNKFIVGIGGEHSISSATAKALKEKYPDLSVLQIDAHSDLRDIYQGSKFSHGCIMRRIVDMDIPTVQVGIRSQCLEEALFIKKKNIKVIYAKDMIKDDRWVDQVIKGLTDKVFITIDVDGLDPSIMPATGTPEPGGLKWYQITNLLKKIADKKKVVGCDIVELAPIKDITGPDFLSAKLIYKIIGYVFND